MGAHSQNIRGPTVITNLGVHSFDFSGGPQSKGVVGHSRGGLPSSSRNDLSKYFLSPIQLFLNGLISCDGSILKKTYLHSEFATIHYLY